MWVIPRAWTRLTWHDAPDLEQSLSGTIVPIAIPIGNTWRNVNTPREATLRKHIIVWKKARVRAGRSLFLTVNWHSD
jgi:hypothetical protein